MKMLKYFNTSKAVLSVALMAGVFTSCSKNDGDVSASGSASVRIVNAVEGSSAQDLYLDNSKVNASAVSYTEASSYSTAKAGDHSGAIKNNSSASTNVSFSFSMDKDNKYTVYYTGNADAKSAVVLKDGASAPSSGKAKVRFIHLAAAAASKVDLAISSGTKLFTDIAYKASTAYQEVDANMNFMLYAAGSSTVSLNIPTTIKAGNIYTIYVSGNTAATITYHVVAEN